jgi:hypothetical protein
MLSSEGKGGCSLRILRLAEEFRNFDGCCNVQRMGHMTRFKGLLILVAFIACADGTAPERGLAGSWRMASFDGLTVPATYVEFFDVPIGDHIVDHVIIRLDSAKKEMTADSTYERRYFFSELHDGLVILRYSWGDHGTFTVGGSSANAILLVSEFIQNLETAGIITASGELHLNEELDIGEAPRATVWVQAEPASQ